MKGYMLLAATLMSVVAQIATGAEREIYPEKKVPSEEQMKLDVQITELGSMRTLLLLDPLAMPVEKLIAQRLTEVDFRVFPSAQAVEERVSSAQMREIGTENKADLVLYATANVRQKNSMGEFQLFEGEATVQIFSPVSGEMLVSQTNRALGTRSVDEVEAQRSAVEKAVDEATREGINRGLKKVYKTIVHRAIVTNVKDYDRVLIIIAYMEKMKGIYHVRQLSFDPKTHILELEIIGAPRAESEWRAYLDRMPRTRVVVKVKPRPEVHRGGKQYPSWFHPS
jgi:hypothetical protein